MKSIRALNTIKILICSAVLVSRVLFVSGQEKNPQYINPTPGEIPIMACGYPLESTRAMFDDIKKCGFNIAQQWTEDTALLTRALKNGEKSGVKVMVRCPQLVDLSTCKEIALKYKDYPALGGYMLVDEPPVEQFENYVWRRDIIKSVVPDKMVYINLLGEYSKGTLYEDYLLPAQKIFSPEVWSYDCYPIRYKNGRYDPNPYFYRDLEVFSRMAKSTDRPFWAYCMCIQHKIGDVSFPYPEEAHLRYEAFSALAYGAQGVAYWAYEMRTSTDAIQFYTAPVLKYSGKRTKVWYNVMNVNKEIRDFSDVFLGCKLIEAMHTGRDIPLGCERFRTPMGSIRSLVTDDDGVLVTRIRNGSKEYVIVVNHSPLKSQKISLEFNRPTKDISRSRNAAMHNSYEIKLKAGGYAIFDVS